MNNPKPFIDAINNDIIPMISERILPMLEEYVEAFDKAEAEKLELINKTTNDIYEFLAPSIPSLQLQDVYIDRSNFTLHLADAISISLPLICNSSSELEYSPNDPYIRFNLIGKSFSGRRSTSFESISNESETICRNFKLAAEIIQWYVEPTSSLTLFQLLSSKGTMFNIKCDELHTQLKTLSDAVNTRIDSLVRAYAPSHYYYSMDLDGLVDRIERRSDIFYPIFTKITNKKVTITYVGSYAYTRPFNKLIDLDDWYTMLTMYIRRGISI